MPQVLWLAQATPETGSNATSIIRIIAGVLALVLLILFFFRSYDVPRPYLWSIRSGLVIFLAASAIGGVMVTGP